MNRAFAFIVGLSVTGMSIAYAAAPEAVRNAAAACCDALAACCNGGCC